ERLAEGVRLRRRRRDVLQRSPSPPDGLAPHEAPGERIERSVLALDLQEQPRVLHRRCDLRPVPDDARVAQQRLDARGSKARHPRGTEALEALPFRPTLPETGDPRQARLRALEDQEFKVRPIVMHRPTPLLVVVPDVEGLVPGPAAAALTVHRPPRCGDPGPQRGSPRASRAPRFSSPAQRTSASSPPPPPPPRALPRRRPPRRAPPSRP